jgi:hypothetical protein
MIKLKFDMPAVLNTGAYNRLYMAVKQKVEAKEMNPENGFTVYITDKRVVRSGNQNRYYWSMVVGSFARESGMDAEDVHDVWRRLFAGYTMEKWANGRRRVYKSTSAMSKEEMSRYIERCIQFCAENGVVVPSPEAIPDEQYVEMVSTGLLK